MNDGTQCTLKIRLNEAINRIEQVAICQKVWLGHGAAIFVEFYDRTREMQTAMTENYLPDYEFHSHFAEWKIAFKQSELCNRQTDRKQILDISRNLVGLKVIRIDYSDNTSQIEFVFDKQWSILCTPWEHQELSDTELASDAWAIKESDFYYGVSCLGRINAQKITLR